MLKPIEKNVIAFIESNTTGTGSLFLACAHAKGYEILFLTASPAKYPFLQDQQIEPICINTNDAEVVYAYLKNIDRLKAVFTSSESFVEVTAEVAEKLSLPTNTINAIKVCRNKAKLAFILQAQGVHCPKTFCVAEKNLALESLHASQVTFPLIVKPVKGTGSIGVKLCHDEVSYLHQMDYLFAISSLVQEGVLVQEYIQGEEYSVESLSMVDEISVIGVTKKYLGDLPYFLETGHDFPAMLPAPLYSRIVKHVSMALKAVGFSWGAAHIELRVRDGIPYIIEINPRLAGGMIPKLVQEARGIDLMAAALELAIGQKPSLQESEQSYASIRFLIPKKSGKVVSISLLEKPTQLVDFQATKLNEDIQLHGDFRDRVGYFIVKGGVLQEVADLADELLKKSLVEVV